MQIRFEIMLPVLTYLQTFFSAAACLVPPTAAGGWAGWGADCAVAMLAAAAIAIIV
jgi:hypothetical protein